MRPIEFEVKIKILVNLIQFSNQNLDHVMMNTAWQQYSIHLRSMNVKRFPITFCYMLAYFAR